MMFDFTSRYDSIETTTLVDADGRVTAYKRRRFLPPGGSLQTLAEIKVMQGDRPDLIAARTLGVPEQFWRVCDANSVMNPAELTAEIGSTVRIPMPQAQV
jgi:hypothetical protein